MKVIIRAVGDKLLAVKWYRVNIDDTNSITTNSGIENCSKSIFLPKAFSAKVENPSSSLPKKKLLSIIGTITPQDKSVKNCESASIGTVLDNKDTSDCVENPVNKKAVAPKNNPKATIASTASVKKFLLGFL